MNGKDFPSPANPHSVEGEQIVPAMPHRRIVSHTKPSTLAMLGRMTRHAYIANGLGERIRRLRQERGWTQTQLAERVGCTKRAIIYYELKGKYPPAPILAAMAGAFSIGIEALMAPDEPTKAQDHDEPNLLGNPEDRRLWRKFREIRCLSGRNQEAIFRMVNAMIDAEQQTAKAG